MIQTCIFVFSLIAIGLTQQNIYPELIKYAPIVGLLSQPFWFISSIRAKQWGIFTTSLLYTFIWIIGVYNNFNNYPFVATYFK